MSAFVLGSQISNYCSCALAILLNSLFLYLIRQHSNPEMAAFRYVLANTAITDFLLGLVWSLGQYTLIDYDGRFIYVILGFCKYLFRWQICAIVPSFHWALMFYSILCFPIAFAFRWIQSIAFIPDWLGTENLSPVYMRNPGVTVCLGHNKSFRKPDLKVGI